MYCKILLSVYLEINIKDLYSNSLLVSALAAKFMLTEIQSSSNLRTLPLSKYSHNDKICSFVK